MFECIRGGAEDYLLKPVTRKEVQHIWQHVWRRQQQLVVPSIPDEASGQGSPSWEPAVAATPHKAEEPAVEARGQRSAGMVCAACEQKLVFALLCLKARLVTPLLHMMLSRRRSCNGTLGRCRCRLQRRRWQSWLGQR